MSALDVASPASAPTTRPGRLGLFWTRLFTALIVAVHLGLLCAAVPDYRVSIDSAYHTALGRQYALHGTYFWDSIHYAPNGRPNLQGPLVHVLIAVIGRMLGGTGDDFVRANAILGVVCWAGAVLTAWFFARRYGGDRAALLAVAAFAGSAFAAGSFYVNLPSGWMFVFTPWALHFFVERRIALAALFAALACYSHLGGFATAPVGLIAAAVLLRRFGDLLRAGLGVLILTAPYWVHFLRSLAYYVGQKGDTAWMVDPLADVFWLVGVGFALAAPRRRAFLLAWAAAPILWAVQDPTRFILQSALPGAALGGVALASLIERRGRLVRGLATTVLVLLATLFPLGLPGLAGEASWLVLPYPRMLDWAEMRADAEALQASGLNDRILWGYASYVPSAIAVWADSRGEKGHWVEVQPPVDPSETMSVGEKIFLLPVPPNDSLLEEWQSKGLVKVHGGGKWSALVTFERRPSVDEANALAREVWARDAAWIAGNCERNATGDWVEIFTDPREIPRRTRERGYCRIRAGRMAAAMLLYSYALEPSAPARAQLAGGAAHGLGWVASLLGDESTLDFRTAAAHEQMRADMKAVAQAAAGGGEIDGPFLDLLEHVAAGSRGGLAGRSAGAARVEKLRAAERAAQGPSGSPTPGSP